MKDELIYIAAPYAHEEPMVMHIRYHTINRICAEIIKKHDVSIFSPINHGHNMNTLMPEMDLRKYWIETDLKMLKHCTNMWILMMSGWQESKGVLEEIKFCKKHGIEVSFIDPSDCISMGEIAGIEQGLLGEESTIDIIQYVTGTWADQTFPEADSRSICKHMADEVEELLDATDIKNRSNNINDTATEAADVGLLLLHYCHKNKINLGQAMINKLRINRDRKWDTKKNDKGFFEHIKDEDTLSDT